MLAVQRDAGSGFKPNMRNAPSSATLNSRMQKQQQKNVPPPSYANSGPLGRKATGPPEELKGAFNLRLNATDTKTTFWGLVACSVKKVQECANDDAKMMKRLFCKKILERARGYLENPKTGPFLAAGAPRIQQAKPMPKQKRRLKVPRASMPPPQDNTPDFSIRPPTPQDLPAQNYNPGNQNQPPGRNSPPGRKPMNNSRPRNTPSPSRSTPSPTDMISNDIENKMSLQSRRKSDGRGKITASSSSKEVYFEGSEDGEEDARPEKKKEGSLRSIGRRIRLWGQKRSSSTSPSPGLSDV
eukprot:m.285819 g.285819  ORF g.285819 m.285819 type:complete len:298 (-) comp16343_c0_seq12:4220-5113(-)